MKRIAVSTLIISIGHFAVTWVLYMLSAILLMGRFDSSETASTLEIFSKTASTIMLFPLFAPFTLQHGKTIQSIFPGLLVYIPMYANSIVWGAVISIGWHVFKRENAT